MFWFVSKHEFLMWHEIFFFTMRRPWHCFDSRHDISFTRDIRVFAPIELRIFLGFHCDETLNGMTWFHMWREIFFSSQDLKHHNFNLHHDISCHVLPNWRLQISLSSQIQHPNSKVGANLCDFELNTLPSKHTILLCNYEWVKCQ